MSNILRNLGLAAVLAVSASALLSGQASALSMSECSVKYKAAKADGSLGAMKWNEFRAAQCSADAAAVVPAAPAAPAVAATKVAAPAIPAPAVVAAAPPVSASFLKDCSASWKALKAANQVPVGMKWKQYLAGNCQVAGAPAPGTMPVAKANVTMAPAAPAANVTTVAPAAKPGVVVATTPAIPGAMVDKNGKPMSPGRAAMVARERQCGAQWHQLKAANQIPVGQTWPQYWSACNKQLKAAAK